MKKSNLIEDILGYQEKYVIVSGAVNFKKPGGIYKAEFIGDVYSIFGTLYDENDIKNSVEEMLTSDWASVFKNRKEGVYILKMIFEIRKDSDGYRSWVYYEYENSSIDFYYGSLEEYNKEMEREDPFMDFPF